MSVNSNKKATKIKYRYQEFAKEFIILGDYKKAYIKIWGEYNSDGTKKNINKAANRILQMPDVAALIDEYKQELMKKEIFESKDDIIKSNIGIRNKALDNKKYTDALKANSEICKLMGYYEPDKVETSGFIRFEFDNLDDYNEEDSNVDE